MVFHAPCRTIDSLLKDYVRVSCDYLPYCFYSTTKTLAYATTRNTDAPLVRVKLNTRDGAKDFILVSGEFENDREKISIQEKYD